MSASAVPITNDEIHTPKGKQPYETPRALRDDFELFGALQHREGRHATADELALAHEPSYVALVKQLAPTARDQRFLITHGSLDPLIPLANVREQINLLKSEGLHIEWHEFAKAHTMAGLQEIEVIQNFVKRCYGK